MRRIRWKATRDDSSTDEPTHLFTPQEASKLLPDIKIKLRAIMGRKKLADTLKSEIEHLNLVGFEVPEAKQKSRELDRVVKDIMRSLAEIEDLGVMIRDIDTGLVDFPARRFGEKVCLCWKYGESDIDYWHGMSEGFAGRRSLKIHVVSP